MPSAKTHTAVSRQWDLLKLLPRKTTGINVADLHQRLKDAGYDMTRRTIERDLVDLSSVFPLQSDETRTPRTWFWQPGVNVELQGITLPEAVSLTLVEDAVRPLLPGSMLSVLEPRFAHARQKLKGLGDDNSGARWPDKVASVRADFNLQAPQINAEILETIQKALIGEKQIDCHYYSAHTDKSRELTLNPLAIVQRGLITYLLATAVPYTDIRQYALHRFQAVTPLGSACLDLDAFDLQDYLASDALQFGTPEKIRFKAWVNNHQARLIRETPLSLDMQLHEQDNGFLVEATVSDTWQLQWWILSQGNGLVVQAPEQLRRRVGDMLRSAAAAYEQQDVTVTPA